VHLFGIITKKFVTMHGHMNVKKAALCSYGYCMMRLSLSRSIRHTFGWDNT